MKRSTHSTSPKRRFLAKGMSLAMAPALMFGVLLPRAQGELIGEYELKGDYKNSLTAPESLAGELVVVGSEEGSHSFTPGTSGGWSWSGATTPGIGLNLQIGAVLSSYTVAVAFQFSEVEEYAKLLTFGSLDSDLGLYVVDGGLSLINEEGLGHGGGSIQANTIAYLIMTRTEDGKISIYLNGNTSAVIGIGYDIEPPDSNLAIQSQLNFFIDDNITADEYGEFSPNGSVSKIMIWDSALTTPGEISSAFQAIPEPSVTALIAGLGIAGLACNRIRRKRNS